MFVYILIDVSRLVDLSPSIGLLWNVQDFCMGFAQPNTFHRWWCFVCCCFFSCTKCDSYKFTSQCQLSTVSVPVHYFMLSNIFFQQVYMIFSQLASCIGIPHGYCCLSLGQSCCWATELNHKVPLHHQWLCYAFFLQISLSLHAPHLHYRPLY